MKIKSLMAAAAALSLGAAPALAATNPASSLAVSHARASAPSAKSNALAGGSAGIFAILIVIGIAAIVIVDATKDDSPDSP